MRKRVLRRYKIRLLFLLFIIFSCLLSGIIFAEIVFAITQGNFYFKKSLLDKDYNIYGEKNNYLAKYINNEVRSRTLELLKENSIVLDKSSESINLLVSEEFENYGEFFLSAWVKSNKKSYMILELNGKKYYSYYYQGKGDWELITVMSSGFNKKHPVNINLTFVSEDSAEFKEIKLILGRKVEDTFRKGECSDKITEKKSERYRILALGGSTTLRTCFKDVDSHWPYLLEQKLESQFPGEYEVFNFGKSGVSTLDFLEVSSQDNESFSILGLKPDLIIITPSWNDLMTYFYFEGNFELINNYLRKNIFVRKTAFGYYSYTFFNNQIFSNVQKKHYDELKAFNSEQSNIVTDEDNFSSGIRFEYLDSKISNIFPTLAFKLRLKELVDIYKEQGIEVILMTIPCVYTDDMMNKPYGEIMEITSKDGFPIYTESTVHTFTLVESIDQKIIGEAAEESDITFIDFTDYFDKNLPTYSERKVFFSDESHFNKDGHLLFANLIFNSDGFKEATFEKS